jgi:hypothetical protein
VSATLWIIGACSFAYFFAACWFVGRREIPYVGRLRTPSPHDIEAAAEQEHAIEESSLSR